MFLQIFIFEFKNVRYIFQFFFSGKKDFLISELDEWDDSDEESNSDENDEDGEQKEKKKQAKKKKLGKIKH